MTALEMISCNTGHDREISKEILAKAILELDQKVAMDSDNNQTINQKILDQLRLIKNGVGILGDQIKCIEKPTSGLEGCMDKLEAGLFNLEGRFFQFEVIADERHRVNIKKQNETMNMLKMIAANVLK